MRKLAAITALTALLPLSAMAQETPGAHFMLNWDMDADGAVTLEELTERRGMVFDMFDNDQNGTLDAEEYGFFDETRAADMENNAGGNTNGGNRLQQGLTLAANDADADGAVSMEEFVGNSAPWLVQIDRDEDGVVTIADFGPRTN